MVRKATPSSSSGSGSGTAVGLVSSALAVEVDKSDSSLYGQGPAGQRHSLRSGPLDLESLAPQPNDELFLVRLVLEERGVQIREKSAKAIRSGFTRLPIVFAQRDFPPAARGTIDSCDHGAEGRDGHLSATTLQ